MPNNMILSLAQGIIRNNQGRIPNTPWAQSAVNAILNGDAATGMQIADNLCQTHGLTRQQGIQQAIQFIAQR